MDTSNYCILFVSGQYAFISLLRWQCGYIHKLDAMTGKCGYVPILYSKLRKKKHIEYLKNYYPSNVDTCLYSDVSTF